MGIELSPMPHFRTMKTMSITQGISKVAVGLALSLTLAASHGQVQTAGTLFVNVDATTLSPGNVNAIVNSGTLGGFFEARGGGGTVPTIAFEGGTRGIRFDGNDYMQLVGVL